MIRILSIDDSKSVHAFLDRCLSGADYKLEHIYSGKVGIEILKKRAADYDVVLLDWEMPELTGPETLFEIRKANISIPVIMVTSKSDVEDIEKMIQAGANDYIMKPFTPDILISKLEFLQEELNRGAV